MADDRDEEERAAAEVIAAARAGLRLPEKSVRILWPRIARTVAGVVASSRRLGLVDVDDVLQEVCVRMVEHPPTQEGPSRIATVTSWGRVVASHIVVDIIRGGRAKHERQSPVQPDSSRPFEAESPEPDPERQLIVAELFAKARAVIVKHYPRGLGLFDLMRDGPGLSSKECALLLDTSPNNVDKIRERIRRKLVLYVPEAVDRFRVANKRRAKRAEA